MGEPWNSNLAVNAPNPCSVVSWKSPKRPSAANGSTGTAGGGAGAAAARGGACSSSSLTVSTSGVGEGAAGDATGTTGVGSSVTAPNISTTSLAGPAGAEAATSVGPPRSNRSNSGAGAGGGAAATGGAAAATGAAATGGMALGGGAGGAALGGGGGAPGIMPPNKAAACRSFSSCSGVFSGTMGADAAGFPKPPIPPYADDPLPNVLAVGAESNDEVAGAAGATGAGAAGTGGATGFFPHTFAAPRVFKLKPSPTTSMLVETCACVPDELPGGKDTPAGLVTAPCGPPPTPRAIIVDRLMFDSGLA
mmetsp:Transcript_10237/g.21500  ORF Transcript_10237/g.21500 Transcript_10237/m.21500 type:complete len:307 (-) Transcript_10237:661-1581(-)